MNLPEMLMWFWLLLGTPVLVVYVVALAKNK